MNIVKYKESLLLYSGSYDDESIQPFVTDSNFFYMTKCDLPNVTVLVHNFKIYVFTNFGNKQFFDNESAIKHLLQVFPGCSLYNESQLQEKVKSFNIKKVLTLKTSKESKSIKSLNIILDYDTLEKICSQMRLVKTPQEIQMITKACKVTADAVRYLQKNIKPSMNPIEVIKLFESFIAKEGMSEYSFLPILSQNENNRFLHFTERNFKINRSGFLLLDIGGQYNHYCSDMTRMFVFSGKFTKLQKELVSVVTQALEFAKKQIKHGWTWTDLCESVHLKMYDECLKIGLVKEFSNATDKFKCMKVLMPHSLGHSVGLDNHDVGNLSVLEENMVVAIEPGIYFYPEILQDSSVRDYFNHNKYKKFLKLGGCRLEDTVLITKSGCKCLTC